MDYHSDEQIHIFTRFITVQCSSTYIHTSTNSVELFLKSFLTHLIDLPSFFFYKSEQFTTIHSFSFFCQFTFPGELQLYFEVDA